MGLVVVDHAQTSFSHGELSPRIRGRTDQEFYRDGLGLCRNWQVTPQGSILMRAGTRYCATEDAVVRLATFRVAGGDDYVLAFSPGPFSEGSPDKGKLRIYSKRNGLEDWSPTLLTNGHFDGNTTGWTLGGYALYPNLATEALPYGAVAYSSGAAYFSYLDGWSHAYYGPVGTISQSATTVLAGPCVLRFRAKAAGALDKPLRVRCVVTTLGPPQAGPWRDLTTSFETYSHSFGVWGGAFTVSIEVDLRSSNTVAMPVSAAGYGCGEAWVDDVTLSGPTAGTGSEMETPWSTEAQLATLQWDSEPAKNRMVFVAEGAAPQRLTFTAPSTWEFAPMTYSTAPESFAEGNYPRAVEMGFQGRLWFASTPNDPGRIWGSQSGDPENFAKGTGLPAQGLDIYVSTKGTIRWLRGQKVMLLGDELAEHSVRGASGVIKPSDHDVQTESAFGSAAIQAVHMGDQVLFVTPDRREVRAMNYSQDENGYLTVPLTFLADHITEGGVDELAYAPTPGPIALALLGTGEVVGCTYFRAAKAVAWWRLAFGGSVRAITASRSSNGCELWVAVQRASGVCIEWMPLHEEGSIYLDSALEGVVAGDGTFAVAHLTGTVRAVVAGALAGDFTATGGSITVGVEHAGKAIVAGLAYRPTAVTLPPEGGNPRGTSQRAKRRWAKGFVRVAESALPLVQGRRMPDRTPSTPQDGAEPLRSGDLGPFSTDWGDGTVTIEQDVPFRTEILSVFGSLAQAEV